MSKTAKGSYTPLDILPSNRNQVIRQKSLLIGCGGGFQQECSQQFSPVADWMGSVDLFLEDEGQQYGNMEEAKNPNHFGRNSPNARWLCVAKLSISKRMT